MPDKPKLNYVVSSTISIPSFIHYHS